MREVSGLDLWIILLLAVAGLAVFVLSVSCICFFKIFYSPKRTPPAPDEYPTPEGEVYEPYRPQMVEWIKEIRAQERTDVSIQSFDGLMLRGKYYEYKKGAPIEILFHGYRGTAERDLCGAVYRCFALGRNALIVDQRAHGASDGRVITFGIRESRDCLSWVDFAIKHIDRGAKIIITGISMGAATVMTAASMPLPPNVVGVLADCGFTSAEAIIKKVMRDMHLPPALLYPLVRLGARLFGGFDPSGNSAIESMRRTSLPVIFFHGNADGYVPCAMSEENYRACAAERKHLVITPGADHGLCFPADQETYFKEVRAFFEPLL